VYQRGTTLSNSNIIILWFTDIESFRKYAKEGAAMGFTGML